jgi:hypothetical protein
LSPRADIVGWTGEVGHFLPDIPESSQRVQSNDVTTDARGLSYLLDRLRGLTILGRCLSAFRHVEPALDSAGAVGRNGLPI